MTDKEKLIECIKLLELCRNTFSVLGYTDIAKDLEKTMKNYLPDN